MLDTSVGNLLSRIKETHWRWAVGTWKDVAREMQLNPVGDRHTEQSGKTPYVDPFGRKAWAKWRNSNPVSLGFEVVEYDTSPDLSEEQYEQLFARADREFERVQQAITDLWGNCAFIGRYGDIGFPNDESADKVALWNSVGYRLLLKLIHGGRETPIALLLYISVPANP